MKKKAASLRRARTAEATATTSPTPPPAAPVSATPAAVPAAPTYDSGLRYDTPGLRYALAAGELPVDDGAKIKLGLSGRSDDDLLPFCQAIVTAMAGNPNFPTPVPTALVFDAAVADFSTLLQAQRLARAAALQATTDKDAARSLLESLLVTRANYVQTESNGNASMILSAAMPLRATPTPTGVLPPPLNLRIDLNGTAGVMLVMWNLVAKARSYVVQCADATTAAREWSAVKTTNDRKLRLDGMVIGRLYAFRVAAIGGATGQSDWSPEVLRMAA